MKDIAADNQYLHTPNLIYLLNRAEEKLSRAKPLEIPLFHRLSIQICLVSPEDLYIDDTHTLTNIWIEIVKAEYCNTAVTKSICTTMCFSCILDTETI